MPRFLLLVLSRSFVFLDSNRVVSREVLGLPQLLECLSPPIVLDSTYIVVDAAVAASFLLLHTALQDTHKLE